MAETDNNALQLGVADMEISSTEPTDRQEEDVPMLYLDRILALHGVDIEGASDDDGGSYDDDADEIVDQFVLVEDEDGDYVASDSASWDDDGGSNEEGQDDTDGEDSFGDVALYYDSDESTVLDEEDPLPGDFFKSRDLTLSDAGKAERRWRFDSFSDWVIEVCVDAADAGVGAEVGKSNAPAVYHVHRGTLSSGTRFCEYFKAVHTSQSFRESNDNTSRVELPKDAADAFPAFLDYLYLPPSESTNVITPGNAIPLRFLADYFICTKLSVDTKERIINDMKKNSLMVELYLSELSSADKDFEEFVRQAVVTFQKDIMRDMSPNAVSRLLLPSSLQFRFDPGFFLYAIESLPLERASDGVKERICELVVEYIRCHQTTIDLQHFLALCTKVLYHLPADDSMAGEISLRFLKTVSKPDWNKKEDSWATNSFGYIEDHFKKHLSAYLIFGDHSRKDAQRICRDLSEETKDSIMEDLVAGCSLGGQETGIFSVAIKEFETSVSGGKDFTLEFTSPRPIWFIKLKLFLKLADEVGPLLCNRICMGILLDEGESPELDDDYVVSGVDTNVYYVHGVPTYNGHGRVIDGVLSRI